jgi:antitoxin component YwqK of YwqJK toxin-antitoxin module
MKRINDDLLDMTDELVYLYEGELFTGIGFELGLDNRIISEISYKNGFQEGPARDWYESGELQSEAYYKENSLHGASKEWYKNGKIKSEALYEFGVPLEYKEWDEDGKVVNEFQLSKDDIRFKLLEDLKKSRE